MKLSYDTPTIDIVKFQANDIIVTSVIVGTDPDVPDTGVDFD